MKKKWNVRVPDEAYWREQIPCQTACPVGTDARGYVRAVAAGRFEEAYLIARGPNPLASICGRVCGAPCEAACRRGEIDQAVSIRALKRFAGEQYGIGSSKEGPLDLIGRILAQDPETECRGQDELSGIRTLLRHSSVSTKTGKRVGIIGSGPAGLAAAHDLALLGIESVIFEREPIPAGMLALGIPSYRLPRDLIDAEIELIRSLGVRFECNVHVGEDLSLEEIRKDFDATIISVGYKKSRTMPIPGHEGEGVLGGVEFLRDLAVGEELDLGKKVMVLGSGNVAYDISRSVVRQTEVDVSRSLIRRAEVRDVHVVSWKSLEELPADDVEIVEGDEEGVLRLHRLRPKQILLDDNRKVRGVEFRKVLQVLDENGKYDPVYDDEATVTIEADTVIWAMGRLPDLSLLEGAHDIEKDDRDQIVHDPHTHATSASDVFLAGDIAHGPRLLIDAVASGKRAARSVFRSLTGKTVSHRQTILHVPILDYTREEDYEKLDRHEMPTLDPQERIRSINHAVDRGFEAEMAVREAERCLDCGVNTIFDSEKCILCGGCADICPELCLRLVSLDTLEGGEDLDRVLDETVPREERSGASAIVKDETRCIRCGLCAERCPVEAIAMERLHFEHTWSEVG